MSAFKVSKETSGSIPGHAKKGNLRVIYPIFLKSRGGVGRGGECKPAHGVLRFFIVEKEDGDRRNTCPVFGLFQQLYVGFKSI
jgi:hypothetical protein